MTELRKPRKPKLGCGKPLGWGRCRRWLLCNDCQAKSDRYQERLSRYLAAMEEEPR